MAAEADTFIKVGVLGDMAGSLRHALLNHSERAHPYLKLYLDLNSKVNRKYLN
jgi:glycogen synthase